MFKRLFQRKKSNGDSLYSMSCLNGNATSWVNAKHLNSFPPFTKAHIIKSFRAKVVDEITAAEGDTVAAIYKDGSWLYIQNRNGQKGFIPDAHCKLLVNTELANCDQKAARRESEQIEKQIKKHKKFLEKANVKIRRAQTFDYADVRLETATKIESLSENKSLEIFLESLHVADEFDESEIFVKVPQCEKRVLHPFNARDTQELTVEKNQTVTVLNTTDQNWTFVKDSEGNEGFIPSNYLDHSSNTSRKDVQKVCSGKDVIVIEEFRSSGGPDLTVNVGDVLRVKMPAVHGWYWGTRIKDGQQGFIPISMVSSATKL